MINCLLNDLLLSPDCKKLAREHHLEGLIGGRYSHLINSGDYREIYKYQWAYNQILKMEANKIVELFPNTILLKGIGLLDEIYPDNGSRFMSDIDLLVPPEDYDKIQKFLLAQGYSPIYFSRWMGNKFKAEWSKVVGGSEVNIELHQDLFFNREKSWELYEGALITGKRFFRPEFNFVYLGGHLAFQHTFLKLYWLFDLWFIYTKYKSNWDEDLISHYAKIFRLRKSTALIKNLFEGDGNGSFLTNEFLLHPKSNQLRYFFIKHLTKDTLKESLVYDVFWLKDHLFGKKTSD